MINTLRKIKATFITAVENTFTYRGMMLVWMTGWLLSFLTFVFLWQSAQTRGSLAGFNKSQIITYYFLGMIVWQVSGWYPYNFITHLIRDGKISNIIVKPISFYWYIFAQELAWHFVSTAIFSIISLIIFFIVKDVLFLDFGVFRILLFFVGLGIASLVTMHFAMILGITAFWFLRTHALNSLFWLFFALLGGQMLPLRFFPDKYQSIVNLLPFRFMYSLPIELILGGKSMKDTLISLSLGVFWVVFLYKIYAFLWKKGLRTYTAWGD